MGEFSELGFDFGYECTQNRLRILFYVHLEAEVQRLYYRPTPDSHEVAVGFGAVEYKGEHIGILLVG